MEAIFEAKYISIKWYDKNTVLKIDEARLPISIEIENKTTYSLELQTYKRILKGLAGQIAFRLLDTESTIEPYFLDASNNKIPLLKIVDPKTNKTWWIEDSKWSKQYKYRNFTLWNHPGDAKVIFGDIVCNINIIANSFTKEQLDLYLEDFRNDFWYLILQNNSLTQGDAKNKKIKLLDEKSMDSIFKFIESSEKILLNPKKELREIQGLKDRKRVKPVARTFMEIATKGFSKNLTSRDTVESYNVAENRYIHYAIQQVYTIVFNILNASGHIKELYANKAVSDNERLNNFSDFKIIDKEVFENEILDLEQLIREEKQKLKECINKQSIANGYIIKLEEKLEDTNSKIQFWGKIKYFNEKDWHNHGVNHWYILELDKEDLSSISVNQEYYIESETFYEKIAIEKGIIHKIYFKNYKQILEYKTVIIKTSKAKIYNNILQYVGEVQLANGKWYKFKNKNNFYSFEFDKNLFEDVLFEYQMYKISAYIDSRNKNWEKNGKKGIIYKKNFKYIINIELIGKSKTEKNLEKLKNEKTSLEKSNWQRQLSFQERQEQEYEKQVLKENLNRLKNEQNDNLELIKSLEPSLKKLKKLLLKCKKLKIKRDSYFPNSMTFVQNPNYQNSHKYFNEIKEIVGIDEGLFIQIQLLEKIGLLDIPTIYERWCFLQIIKVLIDKYHFIPEKNWKTKLANQTMGNLNNIKNVKISFTNEEIARNIDLWYEKELPNRKRPDFVLDIKSTFGTNKTHRLVMDAKFHENVNIEKQIDLLYHKKNYSENNKNTVFILHPDANKSIKKKRTPKDWGNDAYYGESEMFNFSWDRDSKPNHKYGAILLSPIGRNGNFLDNLQRLIGMSMQYNMENNGNILIGNIELKKDIIDPEPKEKIFCLICGSNEHYWYIKKTKRGKGYRYETTCKACNHLYIYNYCWNCKYRLIKNGRYWSYHSSKALEEFNTECPQCNAFLLLD